MSRTTSQVKGVAKRVRDASKMTLHLSRRSVSVIKNQGVSAFYHKVRNKLAQPSQKEVEAAATSWKDGYSTEAFAYAQWLDCTPEEVAASRRVHEENPGPIDIKTIMWYLPHFEHAYYGGVLTIFRFAANFAANKQVHNTFAIISHPTGPSPEEYLAKIAEAFPELAGSRIVVIRSNDDLAHLKRVDATVATSWITAYYALKFNDTRRKFYFMQDFEPIFHAAGSTYAQADMTYRFGFYALTNTCTLCEHYIKDYDGKATFFNPNVDTKLFYPASERNWERRPYRVFFYGRPNHWRNGFELGAIAMHKLKERLGDQVEILSAGQEWDPADYNLSGVVHNLGLMSYQATAELYRTCDVGLAMMFTRHPSYLPFEFMASGCLVVANINHSNLWLLKDQENCLLALPSASCIADAIERGLRDTELRKRLTSNALNLIQEGFTDWRKSIEPVYDYMCDPS